MLNNIKAVMLGHAIGDALGVPVEFRPRDTYYVTDMIGNGTHNMPIGTWSDDTSMSLCALESLSNGIVNYDDIMRNFGKWYYDNEFTATNVVFDVGNTCANSIEKYFSSNHPATKCGGNSNMSNGNGSLMRIHPFALYAHYYDIVGDDFIDLIANASSLTHAHPISIEGCIIYALILTELLRNPSKKSVYKVLSILKSKTYKKLTENIASFDRTEIKSGGYVVDSLEAAVWCLLTTENYKNCVLKAVNLGEDTDTVAAIAGGLAGALYGLESIPDEWLDLLKRKSYIENMCERVWSSWTE